VILKQALTSTYKSLLTSSSRWNWLSQVFERGEYANFWLFFNSRL